MECEVVGSNPSPLTYLTQTQTLTLTLTQTLNLTLTLTQNQTQTRSSVTPNHHGVRSRNTFKILLALTLIRLILNPGLREPNTNPKKGTASLVLSLLLQPPLLLT